jgi:hypothetical protein
VSKRCEWCDADLLDDDNTTCPRMMRCPECDAAPASPCVRPSGHRAEELHAARVQAARDRDDRLGLYTAALGRRIEAEVRSRWFEAQGLTPDGQPIEIAEQQRLL